jgi:predicted acylesterase/phospholipase RssA
MQGSRLHRASLATSLAATLLVAGCALPSRYPALDAAQSRKTYVLDIPNARFMPPDPSALAGLTQEYLAASARYKATRERAGLTGPLPPVAYLAISGGGDDGAFGAGLLVGWSARGDRPEFRAVTGVSTGALSAPFAFLGPEYDPQLKAVYTETTAKRIFRPRNASAAIFSDAMGDNRPLQALVATYIDDRAVQRIAEEYRKGRLLMVMSTNLDSGLPCIWNIGAIAASGSPDARQLIIKILIASSSIPAAFPPAMFDFQVNGEHREEMHVDGGVIAQTFLYPAALDVAEFERKSGTVGVQRDAYIIRNGHLWMAQENVPRRTLKIAGRAVSTMIAVDGINDMIRLYAITRRDGVGYHVAYITDDFTEPYKGPFDPGYMRKMFQFGFDQGRRGDEWKSEPPYWGHSVSAPPRNAVSPDSSSSSQAVEGGAPPRR